MAMSLDWYIATDNWDSEWILEPDFDYFDTICNSSDAIIVWNTTYQQYKWDIYPVPWKPNFIISSKSSSNGDNIVFLKTPHSALEKCSAQGLENILLVWGWRINGSFLSEWLIDEIIVDIQPIILGTWIKLFEQVNSVFKLKFQKYEALEKWLNVLKYTVKK